jgi:serine/threonine protein kinase
MMRVSENERTTHGTSVASPDERAVQDRLVEALAQYHGAFDAGEPPSREAFLERYPEIADELAAYLDGFDFIRNVAPQLRETSGRGRESFATGDAAFEGDPPVAKDSRPHQPATLGDFRILREIGRGGMGVVYEAEQMSLGRRMALKVLPFAAMLDKQQLKRFKNEARAAATLDHPNIVAVHSVGEERGVHYYAMQLVEGQSLAQIIDQLRAESRERGAGRQNSMVSRDAEVRRSGARSAALDPTTAHRPPSPDLPAPPPLWGGPGWGDEARTRQRSLESLATDDGPRTTDPAAETRRDDQALLSTLHAPSSSLPSYSTREYFRTIARLGVQAAEALDHAHQNGILHRDVKPANLLVECSPLARSHLAPRDEIPAASRRNPNAHLAERDDYKLWITDFGLARIEQDAGMTMTGDLLGTLRYMSPEQALAKRVVVDHRSDVYSLGVTLYELLTLEPAYAAEDRQELLRQIAFDEPRKLRNVNARIPQDLETIVLKAIEKNPADRYATAQELTDDLRRFVDDHSIKARRPNLRQRVVKWSRRNRRLVAGAGLMMTILLVASTIGSILIWQQKEQTQTALHEVQRQRTRAENSAAESKALVKFFVDDLLGAADPGRAAGEEVTVKEVIVEAERRINSELKDQPLLEAAVRRALGKVYRSLHDDEQAENQFRRALAIQQERLGDAPETLETMGDLAGAIHSQGRADEARSLIEQTIDLKRRVLGPDHADTLKEYETLATCHHLLGNYERARTTLEQTLETMRRVLGRSHPDTLSMQCALACALCETRDTARGLDMALKCCEAMQLRLGAEHPTTVAMKSTRANLLRLFGDADAAGKLYEEVLAAERRLFGPANSRTVHDSKRYIENHVRSGDLERSLALNAELHETLSRELGPEHIQTLYIAAQGGWLLSLQGKSKECREVMERVLDVTRRTYGPQHQYTLNVMRELARRLGEIGDHDAAIHALEDAVNLSRRLNGPDSIETINLMNFLGVSHLDQCNYEEAEQVFMDAIAAARRSVGQDTDLTLTAMNNLALAIEGQGRLDEARKILEETIERSDRVFGPEHPHTRNSQGALTRLLKEGGGHRLAQLKKFPEAARIYQDLTRQEPDNHGVATRAALLFLIIDDRAAHQSMCRQMLERFGATQDPEAARETCWACLISSPPVGDIEQLVRLADAALQGSNKPLALRERGLAAYRAGQWEEALTWCAQSRQELDQDDSQLYYRAQNPLVEAMALHRLGRASEATAAYDEAIKTIRRAFPMAYSSTDIDDWRWPEWVAFEVLHREAATLLDIKDRTLPEARGMPSTPKATTTSGD